MITHKKFIKILIETFPQIREDVLDEDDIITLQVGCFTRYVISAIKEGRFNEVKKSYDFLNSIEKLNLHPEIKNSLYISCIGHINFKDYGNNGKIAKKMLPSELLKVWNDLQNHYSKLKNDPTIIKFLNDLNKDIPIND